MNNSNQFRTLAAGLFAVALLLTNAASTLAGMHYVDVNSTNASPPYTSWSTAATNIQDAVDATVAGDEIVVTNGTYSTGGRATVSDSTPNRVVVDKPLSIRSVNGAESTIIRGGCDVRCVYLTDAASLTGFTLTRAFLDYSSGGAAWGGTLNNCTLTRNAAFANGGGAIYSTLNNCVLTENSSGDRNVRCRLAGFHNLAANGGGASHCTLNNCTLSGNWTRGGWLSGGGDGAYGGILNNCIVLDGCLDSILNGCWRTDPLFVDEAAGNLRLQSNSPCINAGNPYVTGATDLDGNPRIVGGTVDIGAYEYQSLDLINPGVVSNRFGFNITGQSNWVIVLEASSNFTNWTALRTNTLNGSPFPFSDATPPNLPQRFYRVRHELP